MFIVIKAVINYLFFNCNSITHAVPITITFCTKAQSCQSIEALNLIVNSWIHRQVA